MAAIPKFSRRGRWVVPAGVVAAVAAIAIASAITVAQAAPALPPRTPAQLLAAAAGTGSVPPLTGTVVETASLGVPQLPGGQSPTSITSLLAGSHTLKIWYDGPKRLRLAVPVTMGETDLIRNGTTAWLWQSSSDSVTKILIPSHSGGQEPALPRTPITPQQAAKQALAAVGPSTRVTTEANVTVAGQAAYQLVLAPRSSGSLIGKITIALDAQHLAVPLARACPPAGPDTGPVRGLRANSLVPGSSARTGPRWPCCPRPRSPRWQARATRPGWPARRPGRCPAVAAR